MTSVRLTVLGRKGSGKPGQDKRVGDERHNDLILACSTSDDDFVLFCSIMRTGLNRSSTIVVNR